MLEERQGPVEIDEGEESQILACPMRALDAGDLNMLREKYGANPVAVGFRHAPETEPAIVMRSGL